MAEGKAAYVATNGLRPTDWLMTRVDRLSALGCMFHPLANWTIANRQARWVLEKTLGVAQGRKLPRFARRSFLQRAGRLRLTRPTRGSGPKVAYFVDTYANYHDPQVAEALVRVLKHNGVAVYVHPRQKHCAMSMIAQGALDSARIVAEHNVALLAETVRQGFTIVATEPSAALALTREYPHLIDDDDARLVAANTLEACHYLWRRHQLGKLQLDFKPQNMTLAYHVPCHLKALDIGSPAENLLRLVPGVEVRKLEKGCSGMAGTFGLKRENYRNSLRAGWGLISAMRDPTLQAGTTECCTCKLQMEQGTRKPTVHPVKILALAYGLMPEIAKLLMTPSEELVVT
jgi:Fe-S oxidoreductase